MNGVHDMGGMHGFGPVQREENEPVFHSPVEGRIYALSQAIRAWRRTNIDASRHWLESMRPADYLRSSYYERWGERILDTAVKQGFVTTKELETGKADPNAQKVKPALTADMTTRFVNRGIASSQDQSAQPRFRVGQKVRARNFQPTGHTRLPRYARGKVGRIVRDHGVYIFPDTNAHDLGEKRQHVYLVQFTARELWGEDASPKDFVHIDMWDDYLERT
jgi:nitrile hydratase subunit beta